MMACPMYFWMLQKLLSHSFILCRPNAGGAHLTDPSDKFANRPDSRLRSCSKTVEASAVFLPMILQLSSFSLFRVYGRGVEVSCNDVRAVFLCDFPELAH